MASASAQKNWRPKRPPSLGRKRPRKRKAWPRAGRHITRPRLASTEICAMQQSAAGGVAFLPRVRPVTAMMQLLRCSSFPPSPSRRHGFPPAAGGFFGDDAISGVGVSLLGVKLRPSRHSFLLGGRIVDADSVLRPSRAFVMGLSGSSGGAEVAAIERKES